jgi:hypothetical protein
MKLLVLLAAVALRSAAGLSMSAPRQRAVVLRPCILARMGASGVSVSEASTLAELRAYVKDNGLDVKTAGPGRNKAVILSDILRITGQGGGEPAAAEATPAKPAAAVDAAVAAEAPPEPTAPAPKDEPAAAAAPDGFTWGGTF